MQPNMRNGLVNSSFVYGYPLLKSTQIPGLFSGYHVDPPVKKEVFTMENQVLPKIP